MPKTTDTTKKLPLSRIFVTNFVGGIAWVLGMTVGVTVLIYILSQILNALGGLPVIGAWFTDVISNAFKEALGSRAP